MKSQKLKKYPFFAFSRSFPKEVFHTYFDEINMTNRRILCTVNGIGLLLLCSLFIFSLFHPLFRINRLLYLLLAGIFSLCFLGVHYYRKHPEKNCIPLLYVILFFAYLFAIAMGTVNLPDGNAVTICVLITVTPLFILDYPLRLLLFNTLVFFSFVWFALKFKTLRYAEEDCLNLLIFLLISYTISYYSVNIKLENILIKEKLKEQRDTDFLTGVYSRSAMLEQMEHYVSTQKAASMMLIDVDNFKQINDNYGHILGDEVLIRISCALQDSIGNRGFVGRYGGDEFIIFLPGITNRSELSKIAELVLKQTNQPVFQETTNQEISVSIGIAILTESNSGCCTLYMQADAALYAAKKAKKNTYAFYS